MFAIVVLGGWVFGAWAWLGDGLGGFWDLVVGCGFVFWSVV